MLTRDDLVDLIVSHLIKEGSAEKAAPKLAAGPAASRGRRFISEHELKKMIAPGAKSVKVPKDAIVSPLASDWLTLGGIIVERI